MSSAKDWPKDLSISERVLDEKFFPSQKGSPKLESDSPDCIDFKANLAL